MVTYEHGSLSSRLARIRKRLFSIILPHLTPARAWNLVVTQWDRSRLNPVVKGRPFTIYVEVSSVCSLRCPGCLSYDPSYHSRIMPLSDFQSTLDVFAPWLIDLELYGWGEPFLNRDIFDMIAYAKSKNLFVRTSSNFNSFEPGDAERIVQSGLDQINASLDGTTQEVYEQYRVGASLEKALGHLRELLAVRAKTGSRTPLVEWQFIVSKVNQHQIPEVRRLAADIGVDILRLDLPFSLTHINEMKNSTSESQWLADDPAYRQWEGSTTDTRRSACARECSYLWSALQIDAECKVNPSNSHYGRSRPTSAPMVAEACGGGKGKVRRFSGTLCPAA